MLFLILSLVFTWSAVTILSSVVRAVKDLPLLILLFFPQGWTVRHLLPPRRRKLEADGRDDWQRRELLPDVEHPLQVKMINSRCAFNIFLDVSFVAIKVPFGALCNFIHCFGCHCIIACWCYVPGQCDVGNPFHSSQIICTGGALSPNPWEWVGAITHPDKETWQFLN